MSALEKSLNTDGIKLSFTGLGDILAKVFGYVDINDLLMDTEFNNISLAKVAFIKYDSEQLAQVLSRIAEDENNQDLDGDTLYDHVASVFESLGYKLIDKDQAAELGEEFIEDQKFDILTSDWLSGPMAETDTIYDEININGLESIDAKDGFSMYFSGVASGSHRKESDISGQDINFLIQVISTPVVGKNGLSKLEKGESSGEVDYGQEEDWQERTPAQI